MDLEQHLLRQMAFSHATFGPGKRTHGVIDHIKKELDEVAAAALDVTQKQSTADEWVDVVILALDGLTRELIFNKEGTRFDPEEAAREAVKRIKAKQTKNEGRVWPDWRTADKDKAITHVKQEPTAEVAIISPIVAERLNRAVKELKARPDTYTTYYVSRPNKGNKYYIMSRHHSLAGTDYDYILDLQPIEAQYIIQSGLLPAWMNCDKDFK